MARYRVRMLDSVSGAEGAYEFEHRDELMKMPADDVVAAFFEHAHRVVFNSAQVEYELNGVLKNKDLNTVVALGSLYRRGQEDEAPQPFTIFISKG